MISLGQHLDDRQKRGSVIHPASVVANRADGDVDVTIRQTQKTVRASRGNTGGTYTPRQLVQVSRTDASGVTSNTGWVIIGPAPSSMRGSSKASPLSDTSRKSAAVVTRIVPNPVIITAGEVETVTLYGVFPEGTTVTYGSVDLSNDVPPVVTSSQITLRVRAADGATEQHADLLIDGVVAAPELFHLVPVGSPLHSIWALVYNDDYGTQALVRIDAATMTVFHQYDLGGFVGLTYISNKSGTIYAKCGPQFFKVNAATGAMLTPAACTNSFDELQLADAGDFLLYGHAFEGAPVHLLSFSTTTDTEGGFLLANTSMVKGSVIDWDGSVAWIAVVADLGAGFNSALMKFDLSSAVDTKYAIPTENIAADEGAIFVSDGSSITKLDTSTLVVLAGPHAITAGGGYLGAATEMKVVGGYLYATIQGSSRFVKFDRASLAELGSVAIGHQPVSFAYASGVFYVGDWDGGITRIDAASMTIIDRTTFATNDVGALLYL
jgi:hypothetical protein